MIITTLGTFLVLQGLRIHPAVQCSISGRGSHVLHLLSLTAQLESLQAATRESMYHSATSPVMQRSHVPDEAKEMTVKK